MSKLTPIKFGISQSFDCSYLPEQKERLLVAMDDVVYNPANYEQLLNSGFRRSGSQVYRPHCEACTACRSLRVPLTTFKASRSQKRVKSKGKVFNVILQPNVPDPLVYYPIYERYITERHADGSMYPPSAEQYTGFVAANWLSSAFLEIYLEDQLIGVSVLDVLPKALSAVYTFFDPDFADYSIGTLAVLHAIDFAKAMHMDFLYLGYQVEGCRKMNYKTKFHPYQILIDGEWQDKNNSV